MVQERDAVGYFYSFFSLRYPDQVSFLEQKFDLGGKKKVESTWGRAMMLIGSALTYDYCQTSMYYDAIALGSHKGDVGLDVNPDRMEAFKKVVEISTKGTVQLLLPIEEMTQEVIGWEFKNRNLPLDKTYNCYWNIPCGYKSPRDTYRCQGCRRKAIAMRAAGYDEVECEMPNSRTRRTKCQKDGS